jgi:lipid-A-disaccharide synthase
MQQAGCHSLYPLERLSVMGLVEVLGRYGGLMAMRRKLARHIQSWRPDVFIGIDAPDFNLGLERKLHAAGITTVHYVSPQVWAWRRYRVRQMARAVDLVLTLFPFEAAFYAEHHVPVRFVGHPLADMIPRRVDRGAARRELSLPTEGEIVGLLPGSRITEVKRLAKPMVHTARWIRERRPGVRFLTPLKGAETRACFASVLQRDGGDLPVTLVDEQSRTVMAAADVLLLASGTASLEALLLKRPMVITYRTTPVTYHIGKMLAKVEYVGLPNLLGRRPLVDELLQHEATPQRLGAAVLNLLDSPERRAELEREFDYVHAQLQRNASDSAADAVLGLLRRKDDNGQQ